MLRDYYPTTYSYYQAVLKTILIQPNGMLTKFLDLNDETLTPFEEVTFGILGFKKR